MTNHPARDCIPRDRKRAGALRPCQRPGLTKTKMKIIDIEATVTPLPASTPTVRDPKLTVIRPEVNPLLRSQTVRIDTPTQNAAFVVAGVVLFALHTITNRR